MDLFETRSKTNLEKSEPLAVRIRPTALKEFVGQEHLLGPGKLLTRAIESDRISSLVLYGPPGTGKTTLGAVISNETKSHFEPLNAVISNVSEIRKAIDQAKKRFELKQQKTILFIDEIHRFNKAQQDVLMPDVEKGNPILIGTTTHNPFFSIVPALLSRSLVFELKPLSEKEIRLILNRALEDKKNGLGNYEVAADQDALDFLSKISDGDARRALNALELGVLTTPPLVSSDCEAISPPLEDETSGGATKKEGAKIHFTRKIAEESIQKKAVVYDADEDAHYDTISAFIKSMRGSDPDAALYYLAKMLYAGEDSRFIARRIVICASEDVGNADPQAMILANAALQISEFIGMPEARIPLAQATTYIACAPKSNAAYLGIESAMKDVAENKTLEVPSYLKDASYKGATAYYNPTDQGVEKNFKIYLESLRKSARSVP